MVGYISKKRRTDSLTNSSQSSQPEYREILKLYMLILGTKDTIKMCYERYYFQEAYGLK